MSNALDLLRKLGSGAIPTAPIVQSVSSAATGVADFAGMLAKAAKGELASNEKVTPGPRLSNSSLTPDQLTRLSAAADKAEAAGISQALVLIDGQSYVLDVAHRQITQRVDPSQSAVSGIDGVIAAPSPGEQAAGQQAAAVPLEMPTTITNASLANLLATVSGKSAA
jgi:hypothetical protein